MNPPSPLGTATGRPPDATPAPRPGAQPDEPQAASRRGPATTAIRAASIPANRMARMYSLPKECHRVRAPLRGHPIISRCLATCQSFFRWEWDPTITELSQHAGIAHGGHLALLASQFVL